jgi:hypothetical protein
MTRRRRCCSKHQQLQDQRQEDGPGHLEGTALEPERDVDEPLRQDADEVDQCAGEGCQHNETLLSQVVWLEVPTCSATG